MNACVHNFEHRVRERLESGAFRLGAILALICSVGCSCLEPRESETANWAGLRDLEDRLVDPFGTADAKALVFLFVRTDCPIANRYAPEIQRIHDRYAIRGIKFWLVYPDPDERPDVIAEHRKDYRMTLDVLRDSQHELVKQAGVRVTPEAAVFLPNGKRIYRGRIDDRYVELGVERAAPTQRDLEAVLGSILRGSEITVHSTRAVGCQIPELQ